MSDKFPIMPLPSKSLQCQATLSIEDFFKDSPWLKVPENRRGEITTEPLYPRGRLLGGSPAGQDAPPKSKLAALAAARKKKENMRSASNETNSSVALLDKLGTKLQTTKIDSQSTEPHVEDTKLASKSLDPPARKYPTKKRQVPDPTEMQNTNTKRTQTSPEAAVQERPVTEPAPVARPSSFAQTLFGSSTIATYSSVAPAQSPLLYPAYTRADTENDPFAGPSPDDVIVKAQTSKGSTRKAG